MNWYGSHGNIPFDAPPLPAGSSSSKMMYLWLSDFLFNTMSYTAFSHGLLTYNVTDKNVRIGVFFLLEYMSIFLYLQLKFELIISDTVIDINPLSSKACTEIAILDLVSLTIDNIIDIDCINKFHSISIFFLDNIQSCLISFS